MISVMGLLQAFFTANNFVGKVFAKTKGTSGGGSMDAAFAKFESLADEFFPGGKEALLKEKTWQEVKGINGKKELTQWGHQKLNNTSKNKIDSFMGDLSSFKPNG